MEREAQLRADLLGRRARIVLLAIALLAASCAAPRRRTSVRIDERPTPAQPDTTVKAEAPKDVALSNKTVQTAIGEIVRDTTAARIALDKCAGRKLLPEQEGVVDGTQAVLGQVRQALSVQDFTRARRLAREARSLSASAGCR